MPLSKDLFSSLRIDILRGTLRQGEKLTEQQICDTYKVSRTPVREAFKRLESEGFIESIPNRGAFVTGFSSQDILDMYELRKSYEILAVKWAIERISDEEIESLEEAFEFMEFYTKRNDIDKMLNINTNFHQLIYNASRNKMLIHILSSYQMYIKYSRDISYYDKNYLSLVLEEHRAIYNAFIKRDKDGAIKAMEIHMESSKMRQAID